jgi:hypothetical protein
MTLSESPDLLKRFRRTPWRFQQTFATPLKNLRPFVTTIISAYESIQEASVIIDQAVFEPKHLVSQLNKYNLPPQYTAGSCYTVVGSHEASELLETVLS